MQPIYFTIIYLLVCCTWNSCPFMTLEIVHDQLDFSNVHAQVSTWVIFSLFSCNSRRILWNVINFMVSSITFCVSYRKCLKIAKKFKGTIIFTQRLFVLRECDFFFYLISTLQILIGSVNVFVVFAGNSIVTVHRY